MANRSAGITGAPAASLMLPRNAALVGNLCPCNWLLSILLPKFAPQIKGNKFIYIYV